MATKVCGIEKFYFSLSLCMCMCYTCVRIPGFKSILCFIFFLSFTVGKPRVQYTLLALSPASAPLCSSQQPLISFWGSGVPGMLTPRPVPCLVTALLERHRCPPFLLRVKKPKCFHGATRLYRQWPLPQPHLLQSSLPFSAHHCLPCSFLNMVVMFRPSDPLEHSDLLVNISPSKIGEDLDWV